MGEGCTRERRSLKRFVGVTNKGFEMEADQRHAELIIEQLQLQAGRGVDIPGIDDQDENEEDALEALGPLEAPHSEAWRLVVIVLVQTAPTSCSRSRNSVSR